MFTVYIYTPSISIITVLYILASQLLYIQLQKYTGISNVIYLHLGLSNIATKYWSTLEIIKEQVKDLWRCRQVSMKLQVGCWNCQLFIYFLDIFYFFFQSFPLNSIELWVQFQGLGNNLLLSLYMYFYIYIYIYSKIFVSLQ